APVDIAAQRLPHTGLDAVPVPDPLLYAAVQGHFHRALGALHQALILTDVHKAPADQIRPGQHTAGLAVHGGHDDHQAVLRQVLAVPQHHIAHVAHAQAVHHDGAGGDRLSQLDLILGQDDVGAVLRDEDIVVGDAQAG